MSAKTTEVLDWPENLLDAIGFDYILPLPEDTEQTIEYILKTLAEREQKVIIMRYKDGLTIEETGKNFGVTRERIRQVEAKALRKLRHPTRGRIFQTGVEKYLCLLDAGKNISVVKEYLASEREKLRQMQEAVMEEIARLKSDRDAIRRVFDGGDNKKDLETAKEYAKGSGSWATSIDNLELSVRSYNCLKHAGLKTVGDLAGKTYEEMCKVRNLGRKSLEEIEAKVKPYGIEFRREENDG